ncbi:GTP-binding protein LepA [Aster yellows witches'-broom phytoplasma AYWB]|uniref:Elongation factor 4 n=2 Tax=16SrI (Aster yellows group) TaxID=3042590 RepID=LEPA_AYWBP|nr:MULTISPECIES: translation elongation factor 4 [16SrI (Aster yellows group)]Q2NJE6.1 RecName: Full=Elongation factor 4; Short=EF-4; AltName: Full=Ribosomal back-translocase LepA [Aster yellows witches'-broom phytoplasma AYWB]ABC65447.1 GTP-binding protein LepA [Aster yellows witches'-broom phytoplasma AYWB]PEH36307.1 elongation factor 4 [New Jersey aster yellows phytoplasma]
MNIEQLKERQKCIRNFSIIAHIDHGKSTLADRILEFTGTIDKRIMKEQILDSMDLERERGITIKLNAVEINYQSKDGKNYIMHLIDTPGHVDFSYEVSRSLAACEGALLIIDASQGIQAQTLANVYLAVENNLTLIPVLNKVDLPSADVPKVKEEIKETLGLDPEKALIASGKTGLGVIDILEQIVTRISPPQGDIQKPLQALIFDSYFDSYKGVVPSIRIVNGTVKKGDQIRFMASNSVYEVVEVGVYNPKQIVKDFLAPGDVGYITAAIKSINHVRVGDTITSQTNQALLPLLGYKQMNSVVFCGLYPVETNKYDILKEALEKLKLNDSSLIFEPESSNALGLGFRTGFLGLLHMEIIQERISREFGVEVIATAPSVIYHVYSTKGEKFLVDNPSKLPSTQMIDRIEEPFIKATIMCPEIYIGKVMKLSQNKRGALQNIEYIDSQRVMINYLLPFSEIIYSYFDKLKSLTKGYASFDYEIDKYRVSKLQKMDILLNGEIVDALSLIVHHDFAYERGKAICETLKEFIPKQMFEIPIQAALGKKIIARQTIKAMRKDVTAKLYGGDVTRKKKLLEKQKKGKKKMKTLGKVQLPQKAFLAILATK